MDEWPTFIDSYPEWPGLLHAVAWEAWDGLGFEGLTETLSDITLTGADALLAAIGLAPNTVTADVQEEVQDVTWIGDVDLPEASVWDVVASAADPIRVVEAVQDVRVQVGLGALFPVAALLYRPLFRRADDRTRTPAIVR